MAYYTERHGLRKPVVKTYDISIEKYALLLHCCEKYYDNLAWKYPAQCPDGQGCCGIDQEQFSLDLKYEIPTLYRDDSDRIAVPAIRHNVFNGDSQDKYDQRMLDAIGKTIAVQQIGLLSGSQLVQRRVQFCQLFFLDIDLFRRLGVRVGYSFDPQHSFIL